MSVRACAGSSEHLLLASAPSAKVADHLTDSPEPSLLYKPRHEISNIGVCATSKASDQPAHTRSLIGAFASRLNIL